LRQLTPVKICDACLAVEMLLWVKQWHVTYVYSVKGVRGTIGHVIVSMA